MTQAFRYISATGGYLPVASQYVVSYSRKKDRFPLARYTQYVEAPAPSFFYYELDRDQAVRVRDLALHLWADGAERPLRRDNQFGFRTKQAFCLRYDWNTSVGNVALEMAQKQWDAKKQHLEGLTSQAMTGRTLNVWQGLSTAGEPAWGGLDQSSTWPSTNVADVNTLNGGAGPWNTASADEANVSYMAIRRSLLEAANRIFLNTNGVVQWSDLRLVVSPNVAKAMSNTPEIREYWKYGPFAEKAIETSGSPNYNAQYGLPPKLYGVEVVVEDSMYVSDPPSAGATTASTARSFIKSDANACLLSRPGAVDAQVGPSFSTYQFYWHGAQQLAVETFDEPVDRLTRFHITDFYTPVPSALVTGFLITSVLA